MSAESSVGNSATPDELATQQAMIDADLDRQMTKSGMDPNNLVDSFIARAGSLLGLPPDPSRASHGAMFGAAGTEMGLLGQLGGAIAGKKSGRDVATPDQPNRRGSFVAVADAPDDGVRFGASVREPVLGEVEVAGDNEPRTLIRPARRGYGALLSNGFLGFAG